MFLIDTYLDKSKIHGVGVFSKQNVKKGGKIKEVRPEFEIEFDQNNLPRMPLALANFIETHSFQKELGSNILIMGIDNEKYINHSKDPNVDDDGITLKDIKVGDEILMDYRGFDDNREAWLT
jgi:SET domain-containing protein